LVARLSPYEWRNPHPCKRTHEELENQFTFFNSLWFLIGNIMQQGWCFDWKILFHIPSIGTDLNPTAPSTRMLSCLWAFFTLILVSSYTANLG